MPFVTCQLAPSLSPRRTPKSVPTYSVCVASSRTMSLTGRSPSENGVGYADEPPSAIASVHRPGQVAGLVDARRDRRRARKAIAMGPAERPVVAALDVRGTDHELGTVRLHVGNVRARVLRPDLRRMAAAERPASP